MALGSWQSLYNEVVLDLMAQHRERELLLLMAINTHSNPFGFCFPGRGRLMDIRHCSKKTEREAEEWLVSNGYITVEDVDIPMFGMSRPFYQISPRVLYVREELQEYCEAVFDGARGRDLAWENKINTMLRSAKDLGGLILSSTKESGGLILFSTKESQPDNQIQNPDPETSVSNQSHNQTHNQRAAQKQKQRNTTTMRNGPPDQSEAPKSQRRKAQDRKNEPPGGGSAGDEFEALLSPTVDDARIIQEIRHVASTTEYQAQEVVDTYTRATIVYWLRRAAQRRQKGTLSSPGGWFFSSLRKRGERIDAPGPNGQSTYQDNENSDDQEV